MKTTVIHHSADFDGIFCREIARKFLPDAELIGWDFPDKPLPIPEGKIYVLDLPIDRVFNVALAVDEGQLCFLTTEPPPRRIPLSEIVWIDHHKSSIETHPEAIPGYRIDGVAACRLAWQWFTAESRLKAQGSIDPNWMAKYPLPQKQDFVDRKVSEPLAVGLAGEYDIWDKRDPNAEVFQFGLRSQELSDNMWDLLLVPSSEVVDGKQSVGDIATEALLDDGLLLQRYQQRNDAGMMHRSFMVTWEGLRFLALNTARCNSLTFASKDVPENGHDALMGFYFKDGKWNFSLYHAKHRMELDLSEIAKKHGGGGHRGACGFQSSTLPF